MSQLNLGELRNTLKPNLKVVREANGHVPELSFKQATEDLVLSQRATRLLQGVPQPGEDRSSRFFELGALLLEHGASADQAFVILRKCPWNKFKGREDEVERIWEAVHRGEDKLALDDPGSKGKVRRHGGTLRATRIDKLLARELPQSEWAVESIWEHRGWGFIAGEPKTYKSTFSTDLAISIATATPFLGHFPVVKEGPVLIVQEENSENIQWARLQRILAHKDLSGKVHSFKDGLLEVTFPTANCEVYCIDRKRFSFMDTKKRKQIQAEIDFIQPRLVVFDPLQRMLGDLNINSSQDVTKVLDWLDQLNSDYRCGTMLVHHYHKSREGGAMEGGQRMLGSQALHAWLSCGLYVSRQAGGRLKVNREFRAFQDKGSFELEFQSNDGEDHYNVEVFEASKQTLNETQDDLMDLIVEKPWQTADEYAEALGSSRRNLSKRLDRLAEKDQVVKKKRKADSGGRPKIVFGPSNR